MANTLLALNGWLDIHSWPRVTCSVCQTGTIGHIKFKTYPDQKSRRILDEEARGGPRDELAGWFSGSLECDYVGCKQEFAISGDWQYVVNAGDPKYGQFGDLFEIRHITPPLDMMRVPKSVPAPVAIAISSASSLLWLSPSAAANQLRQAVEELMTAKRIRKTMRNQKGLLLPRSLHSRIQEYKITDAKVAEALEAVKWIGNGGSHDNALTAEEVLVGAQILELALTSLYDKSDARLMAKVKAINRSKGKAKTT